jgi:hypothetical protein
MTEWRRFFLGLRNGQGWSGAREVVQEIRQSLRFVLYGIECILPYRLQLLVQTDL